MLVKLLFNLSQKRLTEIYKFSLGGIRDEAEIRVIEELTLDLYLENNSDDEKAGTRNPLFLLDEIDKVGNDYREIPRQLY